MCDDYDYERCDVDVREERRARKEHRCYGCQEAIRPGDRHRVTTQLFDGRWDTYRHCLRCNAIINALFRAGAETVDWDLNCGQVWEDPPPDVAALAFATADEMQAKEVKT